MTMPLPNPPLQLIFNNMDEAMGTVPLARNPAGHTHEDADGLGGHTNTDVDDAYVAVASRLRDLRLARAAPQP